MDTPMHPVNQVGYLLEHLSGMSGRQSDQVLQEQLGIGLSQYKIMRALQWHPKVQQRKLAQSLGQTEASVSRQIKLLHERGMLVTEVNAAERRAHLTRITPKGLKVAEAARQVLVQYHSPMFGTLSDKEMKQLLETLKKLHNFVCQPAKAHSCDHPLGI
ncbi:MAG TPA: MarR family winged helix-turn-helix transcriptional regulator [Candidatus Saccharimonadales bacterium]|nr:MarR family winged helix-turn-helix transcriptional regulator [Candidatus Saccharimonadales bacterium]